MYALRMVVPTITKYIFDEHVNSNNMVIYQGVSIWISVSAIAK